MIGSSVALSISDIPFAGPTGSVAVGMVDGSISLIPTAHRGKKQAAFNSIRHQGCHNDGGSRCTRGQRKEMLEAIMFAHEYIKELVDFQEEIVRQFGQPKMEYIAFEPDNELEEQVRVYATEKIRMAVQATDKQVRKKT